MSNGRKKAGTPYTLFDSGSFFAGFYIQIKGEKAIISSKDPKTPSLLLEYGDIFGLTDPNLEAVINTEILPFFVKHIRKVLNV